MEIANLPLIYNLMVLLFCRVLKLIREFLLSPFYFLFSYIGKYDFVIVILMLVIQVCFVLSHNYKPLGSMAFCIPYIL